MLSVHLFAVFEYALVVVSNDDYSFGAGTLFDHVDVNVLYSTVFTSANTDNGIRRNVMFGENCASGTLA